MQCPVCDVELRLADRQGVEIDYCPKCRGVWLDRGELDKLIDRVAQRELPPTPAPSRREPRPESYSDDYDRDEYKRKNDERYSGDRYPDYGKKKKSLLSEIFDIFD